MIYVYSFLIAHVFIISYIFAKAKFLIFFLLIEAYHSRHVPYSSVVKELHIIGLEDLNQENPRAWESLYCDVVEPKIGEYMFTRDRGASRYMNDYRPFPFDLKPKKNSLKPYRPKIFGY